MSTPSPTTPVTPQSLWPANAPGALGTEPADVPTLAVYPADPSIATGSAVVVCPGGGYQHLADHEGEPVARWLNTLGVTAAVLRYRLGPRYRHPAPIQDAARALRTIRSRADELRVDRGRVGILGFSAGGHLACTASTQFDDGDPTASDPVERESSRPDVSILLYAVISLVEHVNVGSRRNLLGDEPSRELMEALSGERRVTARTPPTFLFHTVEDPAVLVENSTRYADALRRHGVPFEMHLYERGHHGVGLATNDPVLCTWPDLCGRWLGLRGFARTAR